MRLAEGGDGEALYHLGFLYLNGKEVSRNTTAAFILFKMVGRPSCYLISQLPPPFRALITVNTIC